jgi:hypothetical protein
MWSLGSWGLLLRLLSLNKS